MAADGRPAEEDEEVLAAERSTELTRLDFVHLATEGAHTVGVDCESAESVLAERSTMAAHAEILADLESMCVGEDPRLPGQVGSISKNLASPGARRLLAFDLEEHDFGPGLAAIPLGANSAQADSDSVGLGGLTREQLFGKLAAEAAEGSEPRVMSLSTRAEWESRLADILPSREFMLDDAGVVAFSGPGAGLDTLKREAQAEEALLAVRVALERGMLAVSVPLNGRVEEESPDGEVCAVRGSEPRPSQVATPLAAAEDDDEQEAARKNEEARSVDDHYRHFCLQQRLPLSPVGCRAVQAIGIGSDALPKDIATSGYMGNRGAQAVFMALACCPKFEGSSNLTSNTLATFPDLRRLDLVGQGIANEAAIALADFIPRCPRLVSIDLSRNHVSETAVLRLLKVAETHPSLMEVKLDANPVPSWLRVRLNTTLDSRRML